MGFLYWNFDFIMVLIESIKLAFITQTDYQTGNNVKLGLLYLIGFD